MAQNPPVMCCIQRAAQLWSCLRNKWNQEKFQNVGLILESMPDFLSLRNRYGYCVAFVFSIRSISYSYVSESHFCIVSPCKLYQCLPFCPVHYMDRGHHVLWICDSLQCCSSKVFWIQEGKIVSLVGYVICIYCSEQRTCSCKIMAFLLTDRLSDTGIVSCPLPPQLPTIRHSVTGDQRLPQL